MLMAPMRPAIGERNVGITQRHLSALHGSAVGGDCSTLRLDLRKGRVGGALGDEVPRHQFLAALVLALQVGQRGFVALLAGRGPWPGWPDQAGRRV